MQMAPSNIFISKTLIRLSSAGNTWYDSGNNGSPFLIWYALLHLSHGTKHMWQLHSLRFRDEESDGIHSDLDLETNGSDPDYKPLSSEEMHSFGQDIDISDFIWLSSPELHVPFYRWRIGVRVTYLKVQVCHCQIYFLSLWRLSGPIPKIRGGLTKELMVN